MNYDIDFKLTILSVKQITDDDIYDLFMILDKAVKKWENKYEIIIKNEGMTTKKRE